MSLNLVLAYESSALAAPQSFRDGMQAAANILDSLIRNNITITIQVGYGDWNNNQDTGILTGAEGGDLNGLDVSYTNLRTALASHETSTVDQTFVNSLPNTSTVNGVSSLWVPSAVGKALGLLSPTNAAVDGAVGMGTQIPSNLLVGVAVHELTHAMGREPWGGTFDLLRYTSPGNHLFSTSGTAVPAYFSIDGGNTKLADFGQNSDSSDFLNSGVQGSNDSFNEYYSYNSLQSLSTVDIKLLDALGFNTTVNHAPVVTVADLTATARQSIAASSLFSVTDADGDTITKYQFWDGTAGGGHFTVNGVTQGANQIIDVPAAQLAQTTFDVGAGTDLLYVRAFDGKNWSVENGTWTSFHVSGVAAAPLAAGYSPLSTSPNGDSFHFDALAQGGAPLHDQSFLEPASPNNLFQALLSSLTALENAIGAGIPDALVHTDLDWWTVAHIDHLI